MLINFQSCEKDLRDNYQNSLHLAENMFGYLSLETVRLSEKMSKHISASKRGYCLYIVALKRNWFYFKLKKEMYRILLNFVILSSVISNWSSFTLDIVFNHFLAAIFNPGHLKHFWSTIRTKKTQKLNW